MPKRVVNRSVKIVKIKPKQKIDPELLKRWLDDVTVIYAPEPSLLFKLAGIRERLGRSDL